MPTRSHVPKPNHLYPLNAYDPRRPNVTGNWQCDNLHRFTDDGIPATCPECGAEVTQAPIERNPQ